MLKDKGSVTGPKHWLALAALLIVFLTWILGTLRSRAGMEPYVSEALASSDRFQLETSGIYSGRLDAEPDEIVEYAAIGGGQGYGGGMTLVVSVSPDARVKNLVVAGHRETRSFYQRVLNRGFLDSLKGKSAEDAFSLGQDLDGISGATYTCRAIADSVRRAARQVAVSGLNLSVPAEPAPGIRFGVPEILLLLFVLLSIVGRQPDFPFKKLLRWAMMLSSLLILGFILNLPLNLVIINRFLLGFFPAWQTHLYWYILLASVLFFLIFDNRSPYCERICPFGAAQECIGKIGGAGSRLPARLHTGLQWLQRILALTVILVALFYRNPGRFSYEIFGTLFHLVGSTFQFALLGLVLVAALFLKRPWCNYLCPVRPVTDLISFLRNWMVKRQK